MNCRLLSQGALQRLEPYAGKLARTVLRGRGGSNAVLLPDGLKTVIRRLCKFLPKSPELAMALALDAASEQGKAQNLDLNDVIDGTYAPVVIDEETGEVLEEAKDGGAAKQSPVVQAVPEPKKDAPAAQAAGPATNAKLIAGIKAMEGAKTIEALDEVYIRLEADFEGQDLEALMREYRRIKANISTLI